MNPWKVSTIVLALALVGSVGFGMSKGSTLQGSFGSIPDHANVLKAIEDVHDEIGYSSWTLAGVGNRVSDVHQQIGYSSWTLEEMMRELGRICR